MNRAHKIANLIGVPLPLIGLVVAIVLLWNQAIGPLELGLLIGLYVVTALGVTLGFHRMFTHRAFESSRAFRAIIAVLGSMAVQGSVITWVADHRKHHAFTDQEGDPHSPHLAGPGFVGAVKGLWHAHIGWLFETVGTAERERFAGDLVKDRVVRAVDKLFLVWVVLGLAIPFALGWAVGGGIGTALTAVLWGGFVRVFLLAPRDLVDQLGVPLLRAQALRHRGRVTQRLLAGAALDGRGLAPQPPRVPDLGLPRAALLGAHGRSDRAADLAAREARDHLERRPDQPGAPGRQVAADDHNEDDGRVGLLRERGGSAQPPSSGPIVRPASSRRSQYSSASSRAPLQTIAQPALWILSAIR